MNDRTTNHYQGMPVVVTGAGGYVGGRLVQMLAERGASVTRLSRRVLDPAQGIADLVGDPRDRAVWSDLVDRADVIFHLAGETSIYGAEADPVASLHACVDPIIHMAQACRAAQKRPMVVLAGTVTQAGMPAQLPVNETIPDQPVTIYDLHKLFAERHLLLAHQAGDLNGACLRLANVYGHGPNVSGAADRGVLNKIISRAILGESIAVYGEGEYLRDYVHLDDVASAFLAAGLGGDAVTGRAFIIASGEGSTLIDTFTLVAERVSNSTGRKVTVGRLPWPDGMSPIEKRNFVADISAFSAATGWRPQIDLRAGIDRTIAAFRSQ